MSKENEFDNNKNIWEELSRAMNSLPRGSVYDSDSKSEIEPSLLEAARETKKLFDAYTEAGLTSVQALRLIAEITTANWGE